MIAPDSDRRLRDLHGRRREPGGNFLYAVAGVA